jgi:hypothetical protein
MLPKQFLWSSDRMLPKQFLLRIHERIPWKYGNVYYKDRDKDIYHNNWQTPYRGNIETKKYFSGIFFTQP